MVSLTAAVTGSQWLKRAKDGILSRKSKEPRMDTDKHGFQEGGRGHQQLEITRQLVEVRST
jgi:hypothetical protein